MNSLLKEATREARQLLAQAEIVYGPRNQDWDFAGVSMLDNGPMIRFIADRIVRIEVSPEALHDPLMLRFQLAHEVVHLLSPDPAFPDATMLEEGLAVRFSLDGPDYGDTNYRQQALEYILSNPVNAIYAEALDLADLAIAAKPDAIRKLRTHQPSFSAMPPAVLTDYLGLTECLAKRACGRIPMRPR